MGYDTSKRFYDLPVRDSVRNDETIRRLNEMAVLVGKYPDSEPEACTSIFLHEFGKKIMK